MSRGFEGYVNIREGNGWSSQVATVPGFYLKAKSVELDSGISFIENDDLIVQGRGYKASTRTPGKKVPSAKITFQARADDVSLIAMSHFQMCEVTTSGGTATYKFVPVSCHPTFTSGSDAYGTGSYSTDSGTLFTLEVTQKMNCEATENGQRISGAFCDKFKFTSALNEHVVIEAEMRGIAYSTLDLASATDPDNAAFGSYSSKAAFNYFSGTLSLLGGTVGNDFIVSSFDFVSDNKTEDRMTIGSQNPSTYSWGKIQLTGDIKLDVPAAATRQIGSLIADTAFSIVGTWSNSANERMIVSIPSCKRNPFVVSGAGGESVSEMTIPFRAFESEDGNTAPITFTTVTMGLGSLFNPI